MRLYMQNPVVIYLASQGSWSYSTARIYYRLVNNRYQPCALKSSPKMRLRADNHLSHHWYCSLRAYLISHVGTKIPRDNPEVYLIGLNSAPYKKYMLRRFKWRWVREFTLILYAESFSLSMFSRS